MFDPTYGVNPHQSVEGMVKEYENKQHWEDKKYEDPDDASDTPKEAMEPTRDAERMVAKGRLNPDTGYEIPMSAKARKVSSWNPTPSFKRNFDLIAWN